MQQLSKTSTLFLASEGKYIKLFFLLTLLYASCVNAEPAYLISVLNVGEGDSILIKNFQNNEAILVDTGTPLAGKKILDKLNAENISRLKAVIFTHPHLDHFGGMFGVVPFIKPDKFYDNGEDLKSVSKKEFIYRHYQELVRRDNYSSLRAGRQIKLADLILDIIWPDESQRSEDWNTNSLVLFLKYRNFKMLLMGDGNVGTEEMLAKKMCAGLKVSVLKAGHHGAKDTASQKFLACAKPEYVIISVDKDNLLGYPDKAALDRYKKNSEKVFLTSKDGNVEIVVNVDGGFKIG